MTVDVGTIERTMRALAEQSNLAFSYRDPDHRRPAHPLAGRPVFRKRLSAGDRQRRRSRMARSHWHGVQSRYRARPDAMLGYRLRGIGKGSVTAVMLASMEALAQVSDKRVVHVSDLAAVADAALTRSNRAVPPPDPDHRPGARP